MTIIKYGLVGIALVTLFQLTLIADYAFPDRLETTMGVIQKDEVENIYFEYEIDGRLYTNQHNEFASFPKNLDSAIYQVDEEVEVFYVKETPKKSSLKVDIILPTIQIIILISYIYIILYSVVFYIVLQKYLGQRYIFEMQTQIIDET